ncbi:hypothetical protein [Pseudomonas sp. NPDC007930]|uniref:hypothetical protein n=1 Tax=Pseudomonas sp. NPDC007930 TaxID=3364417 RepID=UPI0036E5D74A
MFLRCIGPTLVLAATGLLAGCQAASPVHTAPERQRLAVALNAALAPWLLAANHTRDSGQFTLALTFDRQGQLLTCKARKDWGVAPTLARAAERACWNAALPEVSASFWGTNKTLTFLAPINFQSAPLTPGRALRLGIAQFTPFEQNEYVWARLREVQIDGIGVAALYYRANAAGQVQACEVALSRAVGREGDFRDSKPFQRRLQQACLGLNLAAMPGFAVSQDGQAQGVVRLPYSPWRRNAPL